MFGSTSGKDNELGFFFICLLLSLCLGSPNVRTILNRTKLLSSVLFKMICMSAYWYLEFRQQIPYLPYLVLLVSMKFIFTWHFRYFNCLSIWSASPYLVNNFHEYMIFFLFCSSICLETRSIYYQKYKLDEWKYLTKKPSSSTQTKDSND